jgi:hypothetical protein
MRACPTCQAGLLGVLGRGHQHLVDLSGAHEPTDGVTIVTVLGMSRQTQHFVSKSRLEAWPKQPILFPAAAATAAQRIQQLRARHGSDRAV